MVCGAAVGVAVPLSQGSSDGFDLHTDRLKKFFEIIELLFIFVT